MREERKGGEEGGEEGRKQGWQGRRGARTSAPRPAPPGGKSAPRPAPPERPRPRPGVTIPRLPSWRHPPSTQPCASSATGYL